MISIKIEAEHFILAAAFLALAASLIYAPFFNLGILLGLASYSIDLIKRIKEEEL